MPISENKVSKKTWTEYPKIEKGGRKYQENSLKC
jgi:hypothetical protein